MQCTWRGGLATLGIAAGLLGHAQPGSAEPSPDKVAAGQLMALVNQERATAGLAPLGLSDVATEVAEAWSVHMATTGVLAHNDAWFSAETKQRAGAAVSGENVANNIDLVDAHRRLMASPQHRANILDARFHQLGIGVVQGGDGMWWITEDFLRSRVVQDTNDAIAPVASLPAPPTEPPPPSSPPSRPAPAPSTGGRRAPVEPAATARPPRPVSTDAVIDLEELGHDLASFEVEEPLPEAGDAIEVASGRGVMTPAARGHVVPSGLVVLAAAGVLANATGIAAHRRRRLLSTGKGGKITGS